MEVYSWENHLYECCTFQHAMFDSQRVYQVLSPLDVFRDFRDDMAVCQNLVPLVNIKIAGKWMFIPLKMVLIGIDPYPYLEIV